MRHSECLKNLELFNFTTVISRGKWKVMIRLVSEKKKEIIGV